MYMKNGIANEFYWFETFRSELGRHCEALSLFCSAIMNHLDNLRDSYETTFNDNFVRSYLLELTLSVYSFNPEATQEDILANIRLVLGNYIDDYEGFEIYLSTQIPKLEKDEILYYNIIRSDLSDFIPDCQESMKHLYN